MAALLGRRDYRSEWDLPTERGDQTIPVKIASYRDDELARTIASCVARAQDPSLRRFAITNQVCERTRDQLDRYRSNPRFRIKQVDWNRSQGLGWARRLTDNLYRDETSAL